MAFNAAVSFALALVLARALGAAGFGEYMALLSFAVIALVIVEGGWPTLLYRQLAAESADGARGTGLAAQAAAAHGSAHVLAAGIVITALAALFGGPPAALAALLCMGLVAAMNLVSGRLRGLGHFRTEAAWQSAGRLVSALLIVAVVAWAPSASAVFLAWAAGLLVVLLVWGRRWIAAPAFAGLSGGLAAALPFMLWEGLMAGLFKGDAALLAVLGMPAAELAQYAACTRLTEAGLLMFSPVTNVLLRSLRHARDQPHRFRRIALSAASAGILIGLGAVVASWAFGERLMPFLFGRDFIAAGRVLPWVAAMLPFALANLVMFQALAAQHRERALVGCLALAAGLMVLLLSVAVPAGAIGAARAMVVVQALLAGVCALLLARPRSVG